MKTKFTNPGLHGVIITNLKIRKWLKCKAYCRAAMNVEETAEEIGIDRDILCWYCNRNLGTNFTTWRKELRIKEAMKILRRNPDIPIALVAKSVGIPDKSNFRKQFHEVTGLYPHEWVDICEYKHKPEKGGKEI